MKIISLYDEAGDFAEDKDVAAKIRNDCILPELAKGRSVVLDFEKVTLVTQSFIHALISQALREHRQRALRMLIFKNCPPVARGIIETVVQYVLETVEDEKPKTTDKQLSKGRS